MYCFCFKKIWSIHKHLYNIIIRNDQKITGKPTVPVVSPVSGSGNGYPTSLQDEDLSGSNWEQDDVGASENESEGGADPSLPWETNLRLPRSVIPNHYDLYLFPDLSTGMFSGRLLTFHKFIDFLII